MAHNRSDDSSASPQLQRIRRLIAEAKRKQRREQKPLDPRGPITPADELPPLWSSALARVKKHIQTERRHKTHVG